MSSHASAPPIDLELRPSRRLGAALFVMHALALAAAASVPMHPVALAAVAATVLTSFIVHFRRHATLMGSRALRRIVWTSDGHWRIKDGAGLEQDAELEPEPTVHPSLIVLRFKGADGVPRVALLLADSGDSEVLRRLRARLRLG